MKRPLIVFDLETTGINVTHDRIVEIAYIKVWPNGNEESKKLRLNPEMPIPAESTAIHGIKDEDVKDCPTFKEVAPELAAAFKGCDLAGFNSNHFDIPMLTEEMLRVGADFDLRGVNFIDVQNIFHKMEQRTLVAAYKFYCHKDLTAAHSALGDTEATYEVLQAQLDRYPETLKNDVPFLAEFSKMNNNVDLAGRMVRNADGDVVFNFGKYKGRKVKDVLRQDTGYYGWMMQGDFPRDTKTVLTRLKLEDSPLLKARMQEQSGNKQG